MFDGLEEKLSLRLSRTGKMGYFINQIQIFIINPRFQPWGDVQTCVYNRFNGFGILFLSIYDKNNST
jgi:hypothetical protein